MKNPMVSGSPTRSLPRPVLFASLLFGLLALAGFAPHQAMATVYTVTDNSDSSSDANSLPYALSVAVTGDTVNIASGVGTITLTSTLNITTGIILNGNGAVLDGNNAVRVLIVTPDTNNDPVVLNDVTIENGTTSDYGGGIADSGTVSLTNCTLTGNSATDGGGGIFNSNGGTATLTNCTLAGNSVAYGEGGGIYNVGSATLTNCSFTGNSAYDGGGLNNGGSATLTNCTLTGNSADNGGGIFNDGPASLTNCTLTGNSATDGGGGIFNYSTATLTNDILYGDTARTDNEVYNTGAPATLSYCDVEGGYTGSGNINQPPNFVSGSDLHLQTGSPCAGVGATQAEAHSGVIIPAADLDGRARPSSPGSPSMGAYEAEPTPGSNYGLVVENAGDNVPMSLRADVQCANDYPNATAQITFDPAVFTQPATITETQGVLNLTTPMSITGPAAGVAVSGNNANQVLNVTPDANNDPVVLNNLTIENGKSSGGGGGIISNGTVSLTNCTVTGNTASGDGGGIFNNGGMATLANCTFTGNTASYSGGLFNSGGTDYVTNCTFTGNTASESGGGLATFGTDYVTNCTFTGNTAESGGGFYNDGTVSLTNCTFTENTAERGGGLTNYNMATLTNDILYNDTGGEIYNGDSVGASYCDVGETLGSGGDSVTDNGNNLNLDPLFVSEAVGYAGSTPYALQPNSPVIGMGTTSAPNYLTTDITGITRPTPPSIGAYDIAANSVVTNTAVTASQNPSAPNQSVTFTATVTEGGSPVTSGSVAFDLAGTTLNAAVTSNGQATVTTSVLPTGSDSITATYTDTGGIYESSNGALTQNVVGLTVTAPATATVGVPVQVTITANPNTYTGPVSLDSTTDEAAAFSPQTLTLVDGTGTATVTFDMVGSQTVTASDAGSPADTAITGTSGSVLVSPVIGTPSATAQNVSAGFNTATSITLSGSDPDVPALPLTYAYTQPAHGTVTGTGANVIYMPNAGYYGADSFTFTASNGTNASAPATVTLNVAAGTPTASAQSVSVGFNSAQTITLSGTDPDSPALDLTYAYTQPAHGTVTGTGANITYTPNTGYQGTDSFTFTVSNGTNTSAPATVTLNVANGVPSASAQSVSVGFNTAQAITLSGTDPDVPPLGLTYAYTQPAHGTITGTGANITYTPNAGYDGVDSFTFTTSNGTNVSAPATVTLTVATGTPTATAQTVSAGYNAAQAITLAGSDPDSPALDLTYAYTQPAHGTVAGTGANITYTPNASYSGSDAFTFTVSNGTNTSAPATVTVNVAVPAVIHTFQTGLQMISFDENYAGVTNPWSAPSNQSLDTYAGGPDYLLSTTLPQLGQGAWVYLSSQAQVYNTGTPMTSPVSVPLTQGWNLIGSPYGAAFPVASLQVTSGGSTYSLGQANQNVLVYTTLYTYPASTPVGGDYTALGINDSLQPLTGYWLYAFQPCTLVMPPAAS